MEVVSREYYSMDKVCTRAIVSNNLSIILWIITTLYIEFRHTAHRSGTQGNQERG